MKYNPFFKVHFLKNNLGSGPGGAFASTPLALPEKHSELV